MASKHVRGSLTSPLVREMQNKTTRNATTYSLLLEQKCERRKIIKRFDELDKLKFPDIAVWTVKLFKRLRNYSEVPTKYEHGHKTEAINLTDIYTHWSVYIFSHEKNNNKSNTCNNQINWQWPKWVSKYNE